MPQTNNKIRIGLLGCSDVAIRRFLPALMKTDKALLSAVASRDPEKARLFAPGLEYAVLTYDELLSDERVDLVYLSLPNHLHEEWTIKALMQGKHVICEKPLACSSVDVAKMVMCARERGLLLYENIMYLHHPQHALIRDLIAAGEIGCIRILRAAFGFHLAGADNFREHPEKGGGAFFDLFRYPLSSALYFLDDNFIDCRGFSLYRKGLQVGMHGCAVTAENTLFDFSIGFEQQYECFYEIVGERGTIRLERAYTTPPDYENLIQMTIGAKRATIPVPPADHFERMLAFVCDTIAGGKSFEALHISAERLALVAHWMKVACKDVHI